MAAGRKRLSAKAHVIRILVILQPVIVIPLVQIQMIAKTRPHVMPIINVWRQGHHTHVALRTVKPQAHV